MIALFSSQNQSVAGVVEFNLIERAGVALCLRRHRVIGARGAEDS